MSCEPPLVLSAMRRAEALFLVRAEDVLTGAVVMHERGRLGVDAETAEVGVHDEVDDARDGVGTIDRRSTAGQHVDALDQRRRDEVDVRHVAAAVGSPGCRRLPLISTSVRAVPRPRRLTVAVPVAPLVTFEPCAAKACGSELIRSSVRVVP